MSIPPLRLALGEYLGQVLTPEVACAIEAKAALTPDLRHEPTRFGLMHYRGYLVRCESFSEILPELHVLHEKHFAETEKHRAGVVMNPDYGYMKASERAGKLLQFTVRKGGFLVGNMRVYLYHDLHAQQLTCREDTFYLLPEHRGSFLAVRLWQFVERSVLSLGVREIRFSSKLANKADRMAVYLDYTPVGLEFVKFFDEAGQLVKEV